MALTQAQIDALPDTLTLTLREPISIGDKSYTELIFNEPTSGQLESIAKLDDMPATIQLLASSAGVLPEVIKRMKSRQFKQAADFLLSFTQDAQTITTIA